MDHLRILHLEDDPHDAALAKRHLEREGIGADFINVSSQNDFQEALEEDRFDLILSDNSLPGFNGTSALALARKLCPATPFIFMSGTIGEERAIELLRNGATDYILKDRMARLSAAVRRAVSESRERAEKKSLEEQFNQAQKLESIGRFAGGIAHDFNNILSIVLGYVQLSMDKLAANDPLRTRLETVKRAAERGAGLSRQLLIFSRKQHVAPKVISPHQVIDEFSKMMRRMIGDDVTLDTVLAPGEMRVLADPSQIEQVLMNLVLNARDAMPKGGTLTLETSQVSLDAVSSKAFVDLKPGLHVLLTVSDTGTGIPPEILPRIFEPFFTTKEVGKGTGLGLAVVYGIVKQAHGSVAVESQPGQGTTFKILLPLAEAALDPTVSQPHAKAVGGQETVLVVDDDDEIRALVRECLGGLGYIVQMARDPAEALAVSEGLGGKVDLLLTDMIMPQMNGLDLAGRLKALTPGLRVLFMSGYSDAMFTQADQVQNTKDFVEKPFSPIGLCRKVREVLDAQ